MSSNTAMKNKLLWLLEVYFLPPQFTQVALSLKLLFSHDGKRSIFRLPKYNISLEYSLEPRIRKKEIYVFENIMPWFLFQSLACNTAFHRTRASQTQIQMLLLTLQDHLKSNKCLAVLRYQGVNTFHFQQQPKVESLSGFRIYSCTKIREPISFTVKE